MNGRNSPPFGIPVPTIGQQRKATEAAISQAVQALSLQIYSRLAADHLGGHHVCPECGFQVGETAADDPEHLRQMARDAHTAAKAFFEGLGVAQFGEGGNTK